MRERKLETLKAENIIIRLTKSQKKQIKALAKSRRMTMSEYILFKCIPNIISFDDDFNSLDQKIQIEVIERKAYYDRIYDKRKDK